VGKIDELPVHAFPTAKAFETWLAKNHAKVPAIQLRIAKKGSGLRSVTYKEALEVALCWGWIDGRAKSEGEATYLQYFGKRLAKSLWSKVNVASAERLIAEGKMKPSGLEEVERAKADGRWAAAYDPPSRTEVPAELRAALAKNDAARTFFERLDKQNRYAMCHRIAIAKKPDTRARLAEKFIGMLADGKKLY